MDCKPLVTVIGGSGFIGQALCAELENQGIRFEILDIVRPACFASRWKHCDIRDLDIIKSTRLSETVVNLAAIHADDVLDRREYFATNVDGAKCLIRACEHSQVKHLIFTSSVAVYGFALPETDETGVCKPFNEYGRSKLQAEKVYNKWLDQDRAERRLTTIRPTVVFGPGNRGNVYNLISSIVQKKFIMVGSGKNVKSIAYVENIADFLVKCVRGELPDGVLNYSDKPDLTVAELVASIRRETGCYSLQHWSIPKWLGMVVGVAGSAFAKLTGVKMPITLERVTKFCATTSFSTRLDFSTYGIGKTSLEVGIAKTVAQDFRAKRITPKTGKAVKKS